MKFVIKNVNIIFNRILGFILSSVIILTMVISFTGCDEESSDGRSGSSDGITIDSESLFENDLGSISNIQFEKLSYGVNISGDFESSDYYAITSESYSYDIQFKAYDSDGKTLYSGDIYTPSIGANEKCSFLGNAAVQDSGSVDKIKFTGNIFAILSIFN